MDKLHTVRRSIYDRLLLLDRIFVRKTHSEMDHFSS